jgi:plastocyanin
MRNLVLPSLAALSLGALLASACGTSNDKKPAGTPTSTIGTTSSTTGAGGHGGQTASGGHGQGGTAHGGQGGQTGHGGHGGQTGADGGVAGAGGGGGATGAGGEAGSGGAPDAGVDCTVPAFCPGKDEPCRFRTCVGGKCGITNAGAGAPAGSPQPGTCQTPVCDGNGGTTSAPDDSNLPVDGNPCTEDKCDNGVPSNPPLPKGTLCSSVGTPRYCDGAGVCVECKVDNDCNGGTCSGGKCVGSFPCNDGLQNGLETDVDCGGGVCSPCDAQKTCKVPSDCLSNVCTAKVCQPPPPTCNDGIKNGNETDVDCGGGSCPKCDLLKTCNIASDCQSNLCLGSNPRCVAEVQVNGCDNATAENHIGESKVTVTFGGALGDAYKPACIIVSPATSLVFNGDFSMHPLQGGTVANGALTPDPQSIFNPVTAQGQTKTFVPSMAVTYPFYCTNHALSGMMGAVFVVP